MMTLLEADLLGRQSTVLENLTRLLSADVEIWLTKKGNIYALVGKRGKWWKAVPVDDTNIEEVIASGLCALRIQLELDEDKPK